MASIRNDDFQCIDYALRSNDPTDVMLEITKQLSEDDEKIQSGFFSGKVFVVL